MVYAAFDEQLERPIALKVIRHEAASTRQPASVSAREARLAASVNHPHICQLYEIGEADGRLFIAMERLEGESLAALSAAARRLSPRPCRLASSPRCTRRAAPPRHHASGPQTVERLSDTSRREGARLRRLAGSGGRGDAAAAHQPGAILGTPEVHGTRTGAWTCR